MLPAGERTTTIAFLRDLERPGGGYAAHAGNAPSTLQDTVSAVKALRILDTAPRDPRATMAFVESCWDADSAAGGDRPGGAPSVFSTALGLIALHDLGGREAVQRRRQAGTRFLTDHAASASEHFMVIAAYEEAGLGPPPSTSVSYFQAESRQDGTFAGGVLANAIAGGALLRAGASIDHEAVVRLLVGAQGTDGGFADHRSAPTDLMTTYAVMRVLSLLDIPPEPGSLARYVTTLRNRDGGYGEKPAAPSTAGATYQALSVLDWTAKLRRPGDIHDAVAAARAGDVETLRRWLERGGDPDRYDAEGWTPLLAAAARSRSPVVELLLFHDIAGAQRARPDLRFVAADALPIYMAGQGGDLETVRLLLKARPEDIFEISEVNGHTVLLQCAFYGSSRHQQLAEYLLEDVGRILSLDERDDDAVEAARRRLTVATNVRGFNALHMARLWDNEPMARLFEHHDRTTEDQRNAYL
ncbi:MAG: ankyrin repeat domain-containing protein, partial [Actinomycetota bacterium]|nr:ankyrin repeat domain-containing protein [Actinomycetota bacterium]